MKYIALIGLIFISGCSDGSDIAKNMGDLMKACKGTTEITIHAGKYNRWVETKCTETK